MNKQHSTLMRYVGSSLRAVYFTFLSFWAIEAYSYPPLTPCSIAMDHISSLIAQRFPLRAGQNADLLSRIEKLPDGQKELIVRYLNTLPYANSTIVRTFTAWTQGTRVDQELSILKTIVDTPDLGSWLMQERSKALTPQEKERYDLMVSAVTAVISYEYSYFKYYARVRKAIGIDLSSVFDVRDSALIRLSERLGIYYDHKGPWLDKLFLDNSVQRYAPLANFLRGATSVPEVIAYLDAKIESNKADLLKLRWWSIKKGALRVELAKFMEMRRLLLDGQPILQATAKKLEQTIPISILDKVRNSIFLNARGVTGRTVDVAVFVVIAYLIFPSVRPMYVNAKSEEYPAYINKSADTFVADPERPETQGWTPEMERQIQDKINQGESLDEVADFMRNQAKKEETK